MTTLIHSLRWFPTIQTGDSRTFGSARSDQEHVYGLLPGDLGAMPVGEPPAIDWVARRLLLADEIIIRCKQLQTHDDATGERENGPEGQTSNQGAVRRRGIGRARLRCWVVEALTGMARHRFKVGQAVIAHSRGLPWAPM